MAVKKKAKPIVRVYELTVQLIEVPDSKYDYDTNKTELRLNDIQSDFIDDVQDFAEECGRFKVGSVSSRVKELGGFV